MDNDTVFIPSEVLEGLEAVRDTGALNMFDYFGVMNMADSLGYPEVRKWMSAHKSEYCRGIFKGFTVSDTFIQ